jgi:hypothetical protein
MAQRLAGGIRVDPEQLGRVFVVRTPLLRERAMLQVVALQHVHDLQSRAAVGVEHAPSDDDGLGGVAGVDGVGEVPLGHVAGVAQVRLDVRRSSSGAVP